MKVTQEKLPDSQIGLEIEISAESSQKSYEEVLKNLARTANIPGFRKGKVPRQILIQRLGSAYIKGSALEPLIQKSLKEAIAQESIEALGNYQLRSDFEELLTQFTPGQPLVFSAVVDVPPTVTLGDYRSLTVQAEEITYQPEKVEQWLTERQTEQATLVPVEDRPAQIGDQAIVDYQAYLNVAGQKGEAIAGVEGTDFTVDLEAGRFVEGLVEGIVGLNPEETKEIAVIFPEDYPHENLAGKPVIFDLTLLELKGKELPELDDDFAQAVSDFETFAELQASLEKNFREEAEEATKNNIHDAILAELVNISQVDLPDTLIQEEITGILTRMAMQFEQLRIDLRDIFTEERLPAIRENARPEAIANLKKSWVVKELATQESIQVDKTEIEDKITRLTEQLAGQKIDFNRLETLVTEEIVGEKALEWLREQINVTLVPEGSLTPDSETESPDLAASSQTVDAIAEEVGELEEQLLEASSSPTEDLEPQAEQTVETSPDPETPEPLSPQS